MAKPGRNDPCPCGSGKKYKKCCLGKYTQTNSDLLNHLREEIQILILLCKSYDEGLKHVAKILGGRIRLLLHDTRTSTSLLTQLKKNNILFYDTTSDVLSDPHVKLIDSYRGLVGNRLSAKSDGSSNLEWVPWLDNTPPYYQVKKISIKKWLDKIVIIDGDGNKFTREDLILCVCDKDGGAHIDPELETDYANLSRHNSMGWKLVKNGVPIDEDGPHLASIRQITHEIIKTLKDEFPEFFRGIVYNATFG